MQRFNTITDWGPKGADRSDTPRFCRPSQPKKLGQGAFKRVYRAYDCIEGNEVAWSEISIGHLSGSDRSKILREVKMMKQLKHENLIKLIDQWFDAEGNKVVIITAMGVPLRKFVERWSGAIELSLVRKWARQVLAGLTYIHAQGVVHRDVKMENLLLVKGKVVITDYGLARELASAADNRMTSYIGTPAFMAPELYQDEGYDNKVDVYAFGMVLLEMITAEMPYAECGGAPAKIMFKVMNGAKPSGLRKIRCAAARKLIEACLAKDPKQRPSAQELLQDHTFFHVSDEYLHAASRPFSADSVDVLGSLVGGGDADGKGKGKGAGGGAGGVGGSGGSGNTNNGHAAAAAPAAGQAAVDGGAGAGAGQGRGGGDSGGGERDGGAAAAASPAKAAGRSSWQPPVLVYDPLQVALRQRLEQEHTHQRQLLLEQQGDRSGAGSEPLVDRGDDLGSEFNQLYVGKLQQAATLADATIKDFFSRVEDLSRRVEERVTEHAVRELFDEIPPPGECGDDGDLDAIPSSLRDAWPTAKHEYLSLMKASRDTVNGVPMKLSDALTSAVARNAKVCKATLRAWCVRRALLAVARSMTAAGPGGGNGTGIGNGIGRRLDDGACAGAGASGRGGRTLSTNSERPSAWNEFMHTMPYNGTGTDEAGEAGARRDAADARRQTIQLPVPGDVREQGAGGGAGVGAEAKGRSRANTDATAGTDSTLDSDDVFAAVDGGRAAALAAKLERQQSGKKGSRNSNGQGHGQGQGQERSGGPGGDHDALDTARPSTGAPRRHSGTSTEAASRGDGSSDSDTTLSPRSASSGNEGGRSVLPRLAGDVPVVQRRTPTPTAAGAGRPWMERKHSDPFGFVQENIFGPKSNPNGKGTRTGARTSANSSLSIGERSPAMLLDEAVIAAISPSGKIQVGSGSSGSGGGGAASAGNSQTGRPGGGGGGRGGRGGSSGGKNGGDDSGNTISPAARSPDLIKFTPAPPERTRQTNNGSAGQGGFGEDPDEAFPANVAGRPPTHTRSHSDPFNGLFIDSPDNSNDVDGGADENAVQVQVSTAVGHKSPATGDAAGDTDPDDDAEPSGDDADIFELNVEEAVRRLQLQ